MGGVVVRAGGGGGEGWGEWFRGCVMVGSGGCYGRFIRHVGVCVVVDSEDVL